MNIQKKILTAVDEAILLGYFKSFCEKNDDVSSKQRLRNIISRAKNGSGAIKALFLNEMQVELSDEQSLIIYELIVAYLKKSNYRKTVSNDVKRRLLVKQSNKCKFCGCEIDLSAHADHVVPFKYVGDELPDNFQMLCSHCNEVKNASIDYEIKVLLHIS